MRTLKLLALVAIGSMFAIGSASADMMLTGGPFAGGSAEGYSLTHYDSMSAVTGSTQEYLFTAVPGLSDPQNYGLRISKGFSMTFPGADVWDLGTDIGDADWALSYYSPEPASVGSPFHSVMYGSIDPLNASVMFDPANDGPGGVVDIAYGSAILDFDGTYYTVDGDFELPTGYTSMLLEVTLYEIGINATGQNEWSTIAPIPEPKTAFMVGLGLLGLAFAGRRD